MKNCYDHDNQIFGPQFSPLFHHHFRPYLGRRGYSRQSLHLFAPEDEGFLKRKLQEAHIAILGQMVVPFCAASSITASKLFRLLNAVGQNPYFVVIFWLWCYNLIVKHHPLESHCIVILGGQRSMNWVDLFNVYQVQTQWDAIKSSSVGGQKKVINAPPLPSLCGWWVGLGLFLVFVPKKPKI